MVAARLYALSAHVRLLQERQEDSTLRIEARVRLGYYPLPSAEAERIRQYLQLTPGFVALDPCIGEGHALAAITSGIQGHRCGIELDAYRAEQASTRAHQLLHASAFDVHCPVESVSLLYLDPPYDFEISEAKNERMERSSSSIPTAGSGPAGCWSLSSLVRG